MADVCNSRRLHIYGERVKIFLYLIAAAAADKLLSAGNNAEAHRERHPLGCTARGLQQAFVGVEINREGINGKNSVSISSATS